MVIIKFEKTNDFWNKAKKIFRILVKLRQFMYVQYYHSDVLYMC